MANLKELMAQRQQAAQGNQDASTQPTPTAPPIPVVAQRVNAFAQRFAGTQPQGSSPIQEVPAPSVPATLADDDSFTLEGLSNFEDEGVAPVALRQTKSQFDDETPATKPQRELPGDAEKGLLQFVSLIDGVYEIIGDSELLGNVIRSIMIELKSNPQYMKQVHKEDVHQWVKAMRDSMGMARIKKQEKKKAAPGSKAKGAKSDPDMEQAFADLGVDMSGF